jgi:outer membrane protein assembly factor BamB
MPGVMSSYLPLFFWVTTFGCVANKQPTKSFRPIEQTVVETPTIVVEKALAAPSTRQGQWTGRQIAGPPATGWIVNMGGPITHPISTDGEAVYVVASGSVHRVEMDGSQTWSVELQADGPAIPWENDLYIPNLSGVMQVLDPKTGELKTSHGGTERIRTQPLPLGGKLVWMARDGSMSGQEFSGEPLLYGPITDGASNGDILVVSNVEGTVVGTSLLGTKWVSSIPGPGLSHPVMNDEHVYVSFGAKDGSPGGVSCLSLDTGEIKWTIMLKFEPGAAPSLGSVLVIPSKDGEIWAIDPDHGGVRWRAPGTSSFTVKPAIVGDSVYVGDADGNIARFDMADGGRVWMADIGEALTGDPAIVNGWIVVGTIDGQLVGLAP